MRERGVQILYEPTDHPWAERLAYVLDPMGNPVHITAPKGLALTLARPVQRITAGGLSLQGEDSLDSSEERPGEAGDGHYLKPPPDAGTYTEIHLFLA